MFDLRGKTALVTGSTQGIGFAVARGFSEHGAKVFVNGGSSMEKCRDAAGRIANAIPVLADIIKEEDRDLLYKTTGDVDILVLNASVQYKCEWDYVKIEEVERQMKCNVESSFLLMQRYAPYMKHQKWGRILTIGSVNQYNNHPLLTIYGVTKAAQRKLAESMAKQLAPYGVTVNNIAPGAIVTPRNHKELNDAVLKEELIARIPCGYVGSPEDIVPAALLFCSDEGGYITGADLTVDGGMRL